MFASYNDHSDTVKALLADARLNVNLISKVSVHIYAFVEGGLMLCLGWVHGTHVRKLQRSHFCGTSIASQWQGGYWLI